MSIVEFVFLTLKILTLIGFVVYAIFAAVIVRQEQLMADVLEESFEPVLRILTIIHFLASMALVALAFIFL